MKNISLACLAATLAIGSFGITASAQASDQIRIVGSSSVFPFATSVAEHFGKTSGYKAPVVEAIGSGGGLKLFCASLDASSADIAAASRPIRASEQAACAANGVKDILEIAFGFDGVVIANNRAAPHLALTHQQLYRAIAKTVSVNGRLVANPYRRWHDIDSTLPNSPILVFGPAPNHGTRDSLVDLVLTQSCEEDGVIRALDPKQRSVTCQTVREDGAFVDVSQNYSITLQKLAFDQHAVGILPFSYFDQNRDHIQAATFDQQTADYESIFSGRYPLSRKLYLYVKTAHLATTRGLGDYLTEFTSDKAWSKDGYLADQGLIALSDDQRRLEAEKVQVFVRSGR